MIYPKPYLLEGDYQGLGLTISPQLDMETKSCTVVGLVAHMARYGGGFRV